jgi:hypothetical protein
MILHLDRSLASHNQSGNLFVGWPSTQFCMSEFEGRSGPRKGGSTPWGQAAPKARRATTTKPQDSPKGIMLHHKLWFRVTRRQATDLWLNVRRGPPRPSASPEPCRREVDLANFTAVSTIASRGDRRGVRAHLYGLYEQPASAKPGITGVMPQRVVREGSAGGPQPY